MDITHSITTWQQHENLFNGHHDDFCYVCGGNMELFGCKTCSTSYHASCMSPTIDPNEVPPFWYCPHCVDRDLNIPRPGSPSAAQFSPTLEVGQLYPSPSSIETTQSQAASVMGSENVLAYNISVTQQQFEADGNPNSAKFDSSTLSRKQNLKTIDHSQASLMGHSKAKATTRQSKQNYSPPRKRSKYSSLSSEVDKALIVIQKELDTAAKVGKAEESLRDRVQDLEQQLKLKDGQIMLVQRELELARNSSSQSSSIKAELASVTEQNAVLQMELARKDGELRDWKEKLKGLLGADMNSA